MTAVHSIALHTPVNEVIRLFPATLPIFHATGIDSCCGGALPLEEAARRHSLDADQLLQELRRVAEEEVADRS